MCLTNESKNAQQMMVIAMLALSTAVLLPILFTPAAGTLRNVLHLVSGFLFGLPLPLSITAGLRMRRSRSKSE